MHGPDLATRFHILTTQLDFVRFPEDHYLVSTLSALSEAQHSRSSGRL